MRLKRYHIDIFCPEWSREHVMRFTKSLSQVKLKYSLHAMRKLNNMKRKYSRATIKLVQHLDIGNELYLDYVFEFYTNQDNTVKKVCYRFPMPDLDIDLILVISSTGKIVTIYTNHSRDKHRFLDPSNYEQGEIIHEGKLIVNN